MYRKRGLKANEGKSNVMMLNEEEGLECQDLPGTCVKLKYLGCVLNESGADEAECSRKVASGRRVSGASRSLVNTKGLQLECARVLHETLCLFLYMVVKQ